MKILNRFVVGMASKLTSKVAEPSKPTGLPQGQRPNGQPKWHHLLVPMWDVSCDDKYIGKPPGPLVKDTKST